MPPLSIYLSKIAKMLTNDGEIIVLTRGRAHLIIYNVTVTYITVQYLHLDGSPLHLVSFSRPFAVLQPTESLVLSFIVQ